MMNRKSVSAFFLATGGLLLTLGSCGHEKVENDESIQFRTYSYDKIGVLPDSLSVDTEGGNFCRVTGNGVLPVKIGAHDITSLRDSLLSLAATTINENHVPGPLAEGIDISDLNPDSVNACGIGVNELSIDLVTPRLIVWKDYSYVYLCEAAHGMYSTNFVNFSLQTGKILSLSDIFPADSKEPLEALIRAKLKADKTDLLVPLDEVGIPEDFRITTHSIEFLFPLYEIAPYSSGEIKVELDRYELEDLFRPEAENILFATDND